MAIAMTIMPPACQAFRVCNLPEGVKQVGFRNSPDINDRCGHGALFEALDGSLHVAMNQTDEWIQVAESRWLPKKFLEHVDLFRVCNLPEGMKQVGFRNSPDINDRCGGGSLFEALDGSVQVAMNQTDEWIQVAESRWLPKKYLVEVDPQMVADMVEETTVMDALTTVTTVHRPKKYCGFMSHIIGCFIPCICLCPIDDLPPGHQAYAGPITWTCCCVFGYWPALICPCDIRPVPRRQQAVINAGGPVVQYMTTHPIVEFER